MLDRTTMTGSAGVCDGDAAIDRAFELLKSGLCGSGLTDAFAARDVIHLPGLLAGLEDELPGLAEIELALQRNAFPPDMLRIFAGRKNLDLEKLRIVHRGRIQLQMVADTTLMGTTLVLNSIDERIEKAHILARRTEEWLGDPIEISFIASFGPESGLMAHHDEFNLILVQVAGRKHWTFNGAPVAHGLEVEDVKIEPEPARQLTMNQGDVIFVPSGQRHFCHADGFSVHFAFLIKHADGGVMKEAIEKSLKNDLELKEPAPAFLGPEHDRAVAERYRAHLHAVVDSMDIEKLLATDRQIRRAPAKVKLEPPVRQRTIPL